MVRWWGSITRRTCGTPALGDAARERGAEEADDGHDDDPEVAEEDEVVADRERQERAGDRGAERARETLWGTA